MELNVPFYRNWMFDGLSSFDYSSAHDWLENRLWGYKEKHLTVKKINCDLKKLDDYQLSPYFIKIDVQGLELQVLEGAAKTLEEHRPILLIESISEEIMDFLQQYGYQCYAYDSGSFKRGIGQLNTFCMTEQRLNKINHKAA